MCEAVSRGQLRYEDRDASSELAILHIQFLQEQRDYFQHNTYTIEAFHHQLDSPMIRTPRAYLDFQLPLGFLRLVDSPRIHTSTTNIEIQSPPGFPPSLDSPIVHHSATNLDFRPPSGSPPPVPQPQCYQVEPESPGHQVGQAYHRPRLQPLRSSARRRRPRSSTRRRLASQSHLATVQAQAQRTRILQAQAHAEAQAQARYKTTRAQAEVRELLFLQGLIELQHRSSELYQPHLSQDSATMATPRPAGVAPRQRTISPHDIGLLAQRAGRRNGSQGALPSNVNTSETIQTPGQYHLQQNDFGTPKALPAIPYASQRSLVQGNPTLTIARQQPLSVLRVPRLRKFDKGLGYDLGLGSNMPSQLPRNPHEAAAAARSHSERVKAMQRNLAADPNVLLPSPPGFPAQLIAVGPPLTGHNTTTTNTLPSVLKPFHRQPMMNYKEGLQAIIDETGPLLFRLTHLEPMPVSVVFNNAQNHSIGISEGLILTRDTDLKSLVTIIQELLDEQCELSAGHDGTRLIANIIEIRIGTKETNKGWPALKGEGMKSQGGKKFASWVRWITSGDMEKYWRAYRIELQTQAPQPGSTETFVKPIFKVRTVTQVPNPNPSCAGGHEFLADPNGVSATAVILDSDGEQSDDGDVALEPVNQGAIAIRDAEVDPATSFARGIGGRGLQSEGTAAFGSVYGNGGSSSVTQVGSGFGSVSNASSNTNQHRFGGDAAASTPSSTNSNWGKDGRDVSESSERKQLPKPIGSTRDWGYYQRLGGDPKMHKLHDLSHVPFVATEIKIPPITADMVREALENARKSWDNSDEAEDFTSPKPSVGPVGAVYSAEEKKWRDEAAKKLERAIGFEDTDSWFPIYDTEIPDARKIVDSRLLGHDKQLSAEEKGKGKAKGTLVSNFFNAYSAPGGSQGHRISGGFNSPQTQGNGMKETEANSYFGGYIAPNGGRRGLFGAEVANHGGHGVVQTHDNTPNSSCATPNPSQNHLLPGFGAGRPNSSALLGSPMATASTRTPTSVNSAHMKTSFMNVHAPDFTYQQLADRSNTNAMSPYLQSLAGAQAPYAKADSLGHMAGQASQARFGAPSSQYSSPAMAGNQNFSQLQQSSPFAAMSGFDFKPDNTLFYSQHQGSSSRQPSPTKGYAVQFGSPQKQTFSNTAMPFGSRYGSPEKATSTSDFNHSRRNFPEIQHNQGGKGNDRRSRSSEKSVPANQSGAPSPFLNYSPAAGQLNNAFDSSFLFGQNTAVSSTLRFPSPNSANTRQQGFNSSFNSGFQYNQNSPCDFAFNYHSPGQGSSNIGNQGSMMGGGQFPSNLGGYGGYQGWDSTGGGPPTQDNGKRQRRDFI